MNSNDNLVMEVFLFILLMLQVILLEWTFQLNIFSYLAEIINIFQQIFRTLITMVLPY